MFTVDALKTKLKGTSRLCCHQGVPVLKTLPQKPSYDFGIM